MKNYKKLRESIVKNNEKFSKEIVDRLLDDIDYRNKASKIFKSASANKKRVMIAEDIIKQLDLKTYKPDIGSFVNLETRSYLDPNNKNSIQKMCATGDLESCEVCEVGGIFMSAVRLNGDAKTNSSYLSFNQVFNTLKKYYTLEQIILMELAFEGGSGYFRIANSKTQYIKSMQRFTKTLIEFCIEFVKNTPKITFVGGTNGNIYTTTSQKMKIQIINALQFYTQNPQMKDRFRLIQMNIIENKGRIVF